MSFATIPGQTRAKQVLQNALRGNRLSHAYIFSGPSGSGRKRTALKLAQAIYCTERTDDACGACLNCRKVEHGNHPDLYIVEPDGASIKIEQIRELQKKFAYRSTSALTKIYILQDADRMTVQAANSLLKFLEEPQTGALAILLTENGNALLPTIRSRAQWVAFVPPDRRTMADALLREGLSPAVVWPAVHLAAGVDAARELAQAEWFAEARNVVLQLAKEAATRFPEALLSVQKLVKSELGERLPVLLDMWMLWCKDMVHLHYGRKDHLIYGDQADWMAGQAFSRAAGEWVRWMDRAVETQKRLRFHANPQLALESMLLDIQGG
ncbi:DNA polymerase III subunit delta' [Paenibacillus cymbidii]|uniref:DNA polymerase III subunit delta' n=1 Tax=Paenibacillus cymbidii TaxID=1639034 RepID=UPI001081DA4C|nr:DNA polymerase III subunit delta' [Paenibacillus cymbidii]